MTARAAARRAEELRRILEANAPKDAAVILHRLDMAERKR